MIPVPSDVRVWLAVGRTDMMGWTPLANQGQAGPAFQRGITMDVKVIGVDIAKRYFQVHGVGGSGMVTIRRKISRDGFLKLLADLPPCLHRLGGLLRRPSLGTRDGASRPRCQTDAAAIRSAIRQNQQERRPRR